MGEGGQGLLMEELGQSMAKRGVARGEPCTPSHLRSCLWHHDAMDLTPGAVTSEMLPGAATELSQTGSDSSEAVGGWLREELPSPGPEVCGDPAPRGPARSRPQ